MKITKKSFFQHRLNLQQYSAECTSYYFYHARSLSKLKILPSVKFLRKFELKKKGWNGVVEGVVESVVEIWVVVGVVVVLIVVVVGVVVIMVGRIVERIARAVLVASVCTV